MSGEEFFAAGRLEAEIARRAAACGIAVDEAGAGSLALHARAVLAANERLHLTTIVEPHEFLERHIGEAFEGAALLDPALAGVHVDVGSGNGYPALPLTVARPGLNTLLVDASHKKAEFLRRTVERCGLSERVRVVERHVQRAAELEDAGPVRVLTARAVGGWSRLLPKLAPILEPDGRLILWSGEEVESVRQREAWRKFELISSHPLPGMLRAAIWMFRRAGGQSV